jgi:hypothetical protein
MVIRHTATLSAWDTDIRAIRIGMSPDSLASDGVVTDGDMVGMRGGAVITGAPPAIGTAVAGTDMAVATAMEVVGTAADMVEEVVAVIVRSATIVLLFGAIVVMLTGCVSPEELRAQDEADCRSFGFQSGTTDFANCLQRESLWRRYSVPQPGWWGPGWYGPGYYPPPPGMI